jgi:tripartite-type tricarboxylate transporter receptor subunit TctC
MTRSSRTFRSLVVGSAFTLLATVASAQTTPSGGAQAGLYKLVVPFAAGGAADMVGRTIAAGLRKEGLSEVLVENRPGASTQVAVTHVKNAAPDGLTMLLTTSASFVLFPYAYKSLPYAPEDLRPVAQLVDIPTAFVAGTEQPYQDFKGYIDWIRANPSNANLGLAAQGSSGHFGSIKLGQDLGLQLTPVVYRGAAPMLVDVAAGRVSAGYDAVASMMSLYQGNKIKFLAVTGANRLPALPKVPTAKELGFPQFEHALPFYAIYVPARTPDAAVAKLQQALLNTLKQPEVIAKLESAGFVVAPLDAGRTAARIDAERKFWEPVIKAAGVQLE